MKKGEKIYQLIIKYNDDTCELLSIRETIDRVQEEEWKDVEPLISVSEDPIYLSDYIDEDWLELTDTIGVVGIT